MAESLHALVYVHGGLRIPCGEELALASPSAHCATPQRAPHGTTPSAWASPAPAQAGLSRNRPFWRSITLGVKISAVGTLASPPQPWQQALVLELDCATKTLPPKGLPAPSPACVSVFCSPKAWRAVQAEAEQGNRLLAEGEACLDVPRSVAPGDLVMVALRLTILPPKPAPAQDADPLPPPATPPPTDGA